MTDLIDRAALLADIEDTVVFSGRNSRNAEVRGVTKIIDRIKAAPAVDAETVKYGEWVDHCVRDWRCSECGEKLNKVRFVDGYCYTDKPNYCPNCGAKMDLEEEDG